MNGDFKKGILVTLGVIVALVVAGWILKAVT